MFAQAVAAHALLDKLAIQTITIQFTGHTPTPTPISPVCGHTELRVDKLLSRRPGLTLHNLA